MSTHRGRFFVSGPLEQLYDWTRSYYEGRGFSPDTGSERPRLLFMRRGTALGRHRIQDCRTELRVTFQSEGPDASVECRYDIRSTDLLMSDREFLEKEIEGLRRALLAQGGARRCAKCGNPLASEFRVCPYCGEAVAREPPRCPKCARLVEPEFQFCPGCGTALRESVISLR